MMATTSASTSKRPYGLRSGARTCPSRRGRGAAVAARATKTALVTGANSGIGRETVRELVKAGYSSVILACRDVEAGEEARSEIASSLGGDAASRMSVSRLNLSSLDSVRELAASFSERNDSCDLLVNNAGVMMIPELRRTDDGFEEHWGINYLGHYLLTSLMLGPLRKSERARVVNVSSAANSFGKLDLGDMDYARGGYDPWQAYGNSKLGNLMFTFELDRRLRESGISNVSVNAVHPGLVKTNLGRYMNPLVTKVFQLLPEFFVLTPEQGARTQVQVALSEDFEGVSGKYYADQTFKFKPGQFAEEDVVMSPSAKDEGLLRDLWDYSREATGASWDALRPIEQVAAPTNENA